MNLVCIVCPKGCKLTATKTGDEVQVSGNSCPRGEAFAKSELLHPVRSLTTTLKSTKENILVPVRTDGEISKELIFEAMRQLSEAVVQLPVHCGDIVVTNLLDTGVNVICTCTYADI